MAGSLWAINTSVIRDANQLLFTSSVHISSVAWLCKHTLKPAIEHIALILSVFPFTAHNCCKSVCILWTSLLFTVKIMAACTSDYPKQGEAGWRSLPIRLLMVMLMRMPGGLGFVCLSAINTQIMSAVYGERTIQLSMLMTLFVLSQCRRLILPVEEESARLI